MIKTKIKNGPHGFTTYKDFFQRLGNGGDSIPVEENAKTALLNRLVQLEDDRFFPYDGVTEDFLASGLVREVRRLPNDGEYVRYEVSVQRHDGSWDGPYQLMSLWDRRGKLVAYTFIYGEGGAPEFVANMHVVRGNLVPYRFTTSEHDVVSFLEDMNHREGVCVENNVCDGEFITFGYEDGLLLMSWQVCSRSWEVNSTKEMTVADATRAVAHFREEGIVGVQELQEWEMAEHYDCVTRKTTIDVDQYLRRQLRRAVRTGNVFVERMLLAVGVTVDGCTEPPCELMVQYGSRQEMLETIYDQEIWSKRDSIYRRNRAGKRINKVLAYLALHDLLAAWSNLAERFLLGDTIDRDKTIAEYCVQEAVRIEDQFEYEGV